MTVDMEAGYTRKIIEYAGARDMLRNQLAYCLATAWWETDKTMMPIREAYWLSESWREANLRYYPWYGRGFVQLTWDYNYQKADDGLKLDGALMANPDLAMEPEYAAPIFYFGMTQGLYTGKKLDDYITLQQSDFINARRIVNGTDQASTIASLASEYDAILLAEGYGVQPAVPDPAPIIDEVLARAEEVKRRFLALERWAITQGYEPPEGDA